MGQSLAPAFEKLRDLSSGEALALLKSFRVEGYDFGLDLPKVCSLVGIKRFVMITMKGKMGP